MLVPPWDWYDKQDRVLQILHPHRDDDHLGWGWPLICGVLPVCRCIFTAREVQIKPPCPPGQIPSFVQAKRRLYLTATLADDSVVVTHFGANPACISTPITPGAADDIGDRMILAPQEVRPDWTDSDIKAYVTDLARKYNAAVGQCQDGQQTYLVEVQRALGPGSDSWEAFTGFLRRIVAANTHGLTIRLAGPSGRPRSRWPWPSR
jgi:hypothetical protein